MKPAASHDLAATLQAGVHALGLDLSSAQQQSLLDFLDLLQKWNKVYNLTAVRNPQEMLTHHLLDSLAAVPALQRQLATQPGAARLLDVGCGGGLPGVVFAICCPQLTVHCVDTVAKKAAFIQQAAASLHLPNLTGIHARVESLTGPYAVVSSRAFAALADFAAGSAANTPPAASSSPIAAACSRAFARAMQPGARPLNGTARHCVSWCIRSLAQ